MAKSRVNRYVARWNATLKRKEWRRIGRSTLVVDGGTVTPNPTMGVSLTHTPTNPSPGATVTLTTTITGGTAPFTLTWTAPSGVTLSGSDNTRTFTAPTTSTALAFRVSVQDAAGQVQEATASVQVQSSTQYPVRFPGHVPNRVLLGMATPAGNPPPGWTEARQIIGQPIYEARRFTGSWVSASEFNQMVGEADAASALPVISFKPNGDGAYASDTAAWTAVANGQRNDGLLTLFNLAVSYNKNLLCSFHHEPSGDGTLTEWARMNVYCTWFFAGYRNGSWNGSTFNKGTYNAAHDISIHNGGKFGWAPVGNGFWWRPTTPQAAADQAWSPQAIEALNACGGVMLNDFYDADYVNQDLAYTDQQYRVAGSGVRTWKRISNFMAWARQRGVLAAGAGEYGCIDAAEMDRCWNIMRNNRDIWAIGNYFNSMANSDHEWRLIPADFRDTTYESSKKNSAGVGFQDLGGTQQRADCLASFKAHLTQSISPEYTSPLGG